VDEFLLVARTTFKDALCQLCNSWCNRVCPRVIEAEFGSGFFCGDFCWRFDGGAQGIWQTTKKPLTQDQAYGQQTT
jgi:hypothetical protein